MKYFIVLLLLCFGLWGCNPIDYFSAEVKEVRTSKLKGCPSKTIEKMVSDSIDFPRWSKDKTESGRTVVNVKGKTMFDGKSIPAELQFRFSKDKSTFSFYSLKLNGQEQSDFVIGVFIDSMCDR